MTESVTFTGHRFIPYQKMEVIRDALAKAVREHYYKGIRNFNCGMAIGFDLLAAEVVLSLKEKLTDLRLTAVVPYPHQYEKWTGKDKDRYRHLLDKSDTVIVLSRNYYKGCLLRRNDYMLSHCKGVIAYYDGTPKGGTYYTIRKARQMRLPVLNLF